MSQWACEDVESAALRQSFSEHSVPDRLKRMNTAMVAREKMTALLQDVGLLNRAATDLAIDLPTAAQIRSAIETVQLEQHGVVSEAEQTWRPDDDDVCAAAHDSDGTNASCC